MMAWLQRRPLIAALAGLAVLLALLIGVETGFGGLSREPRQRDSARSTAPPEAKLLPPMVAQAPEQAFPEMAARPLFTPTRRLAPAEPAGGKAAFARGQFVLQGVIVVGEQRTALLREKTSGRVHRVERGKDLNGITVESIEPTEVTLVMGGEREKLALVVQRPEGAARVGAASAAPAPAQGPFGASEQGNVPVAAPVQAPSAAQAVAATANPIARAAPATPLNPGSATGSQPTTQPMTPEELLARRRARRNQPTQ